MTYLFVSYGREDIAPVRAVVECLKKNGIEYWLDDERLLVGQKWNDEIRTALDGAAGVLIFLSKSSVDRVGYVQKERRDTIQLGYRQPLGRGFSFPIRIDDCEIPAQFADAQYLDLRDPKWPNKLIAGIQHHLKIGHAPDDAGSIPGVILEEPRGPNAFRTLTINDMKDGTPGYRIDCRFPEIDIRLDPFMAAINQIIVGHVANTAAKIRAYALPLGVQQPGENPFSISGELSIGFKVFRADKKIISVGLMESHYYPGAAHGNNWTTTFNFSVPHKARFHLGELLKPDGQALTFLSAFCRSSLIKQLGDDADVEWIGRGASETRIESMEFACQSHTVTLFFPPYAVAAFAFGAQTVDVPLDQLRGHLNLDNPICAELFGAR
ncbi:MAG: TIR domain-containing protein [Reyranella sp.]|nr:TIR domain-containing protein [Reyranella sp.]